MSQYDPFRFSNLNPQLVSEMVVGNVEQTPTLLSQYDVNNDGKISLIDQQIIQNNHSQMKASGMQFADMNMPMVNPMSQQTQIQTPSMARPIGQPLPTTAPAQPQTIGEGQRNFDRLNVQQALDLSVGNTKMTPTFMKQYDVNEDGTVNIMDVLDISDQKKARAKQNLAPFGSQAFNPQVQTQTQSMARPIAQPKPATMASPAMASTQNPFARSMEDGGVVYMSKGTEV